MVAYPRPTQDQAGQNFSEEREETQEAPPLAEELGTADGFWGIENLFLFKMLIPGRSTKLQWTDTGVSFMSRVNGSAMDGGGSMNGGVESMNGRGGGGWRA